MEKEKIVEMALAAAEPEIAAARTYVAQIEKLGHDKALKDVLEAGHLAEIEIHMERAADWILAAKHIREMVVA